MAQNTVYLRGVAKWVKAKDPDPKYHNYSLDLFPDEQSWELYEQTGVELKRRESEEGTFLKLRRPVEKLVKGEVVHLGPPKVFLLNEVGEAHPFEGLVGNGSKVVCKVVVYEGGRGKGHRLESILVEELVEYEPNKVLNDEEFPF